jgi:hypothetical protein
MPRSRFESGMGGQGEEGDEDPVACKTWTGGSDAGGRGTEVKNEEESRKKAESATQPSFVFAELLYIPVVLAVTPKKIFSTRRIK